MLGARSPIAHEALIDRDQGRHVLRPGDVRAGGGQAFGGLFPCEELMVAVNRGFRDLTAESNYRLRDRCPSIVLLGSVVPRVEALRDGLFL